MKSTFPSALLLAFALLTPAVLQAAVTNLAPSGTPSASSEGYGSVAADAIDGNRNGAFGAGSVFHTNNESIQSYWQVQLPGVRFLDHIRIFNRTDAIQGSFGNFRIIAKNGATTVFDQTFLPANAADENSSKAWGTAALRGIQANLVRIERVSQTVPNVNFLTFAECEIWGSATALDARIIPSSVSASTAGFSTLANDANDGDINGNLSGPGFPIYQSQAQGIGQFWEMTLPGDYLVKSLLVMNRTDAITTTTVKISLLNSAGTTVWTQNQDLSVGATSPHNYGIQLAPETAARKVRVETLTNQFLSLAEVQAFGPPVTVVPPVVENQPASAIAASLATLGATVTNTGFEPPTVRIYYGTSDGGTVAASWQNSVLLGPQAGSASAQVTGLSPQTSYYFRAFAQNSAGSDWANSSGTFTTIQALPATLEILPATGITGYTSLLSGRILTVGSDQPTVSIFWGTSDAGATATGWQSSALLGLDSGPFGTLAGNLQPGTEYYFRAAATNAAGTTWSAPMSFVTNAEPPIVINEIHYKPLDRTKDTQFIELWNPSTSAIDISGWRLAEGVDFLFPPATSMPGGSYRVIAANSAAFLSYYGTAPFGQWTGELKKTGEIIELFNANSDKVDDVDFAPGFPWPTSASGAGPSIELIHPSLENDVGGAWRSSTHGPLPQTPGFVNASLTVEIPPLIRNVIHSPALPQAGQEVAVFATITDVHGIAAATLEYQVVSPGNYLRKTDPAYSTSWTALPMNDAGLGADSMAGDGNFAATIPLGIQTHRRLVRYRISATDALGTSITVPYLDDEQPNFAYFVYNGLSAWNGALQPGAGGARGTVQNYPPAMLASIEPWHLIANATDVANSQYNSSYNDQRFYATLVYDGNIYDHILFKNRGKGSIYVSGKNKWELLFNRARDIRIKDNWGNYYEPWNSLALNANASPWCAVHRGSAGVEEALSYRMFEIGGIPALRTSYVHWRVIDNAAESGPTQYDGDLWGLYLALEPMEGNYLDERDLPDGNIYNIEGGQGDKTRQGATHPTDASDWNAFRDGANQAGQTELWYQQNLDLKALYSFYALNRLNGNVDVRGGDNVRFYHNPTNINGGTNGHWVVAPYDLDMMFVCGDHWSANIDGVTWPGVTDQFRAITRHPAIAREYRNRARELLDLMAADANLGGGQVGQLVEEYARMVSPAGAAQTWAGLDAALWNMHPSTAGSGAANSNSGYTSHKNNFLRTPYFDYRGVNPVATTNWTRTLSDPDGDGYSDFNGLMTWFRNYATNTWPGGSWTRSNGNQNGYGYKFLEWESLYGGMGINPTAPDLTFPNTPSITYIGPLNFPANALDFSSSAFSPSPNGGAAFAAMQWRIGEIYAPGIAGYTPGDPWRYELEEVWTSPEIAIFNATKRVPVSAARPGITYRARVRHKGANGSWSHWSAPVQFTVSSPDISLYQQSLAVSEFHYHPAAATPAESTAGFTDESFEWLELKNVGNQPVDMTDLRFTKGVDFDFPSGWAIAPGGYALVVKNLAAFQSRYGHGFDAIIAGNYGGDNLKNSGEEIKLSYGAGTGIISFTYEESIPWPAAADGQGPSVVLIAPDSLPNHSDPLNWRASMASGGTPGGDDAVHFSGSPHADDDLDGWSNLVEYALGEDPEISYEMTPGGLAIYLPRIPNADDAEILGECSLNLSSWVNAELIDSSPTSLTYQVPAEYLAEPRVFLRAKVRLR